MKFFSKKNENLNQKDSKVIIKRLKIVIGALLVLVVVLGYQQFFALAQYMLDTFDTDTNVADTWRATVATSTGDIMITEKEAPNCTTWTV